MTTTTQPTPKTFPLGQIAATPGALEPGIDLLPLLRPHAPGDWGEMCEEDLRVNDDARVRGRRQRIQLQLISGEPRHNLGRRLFWWSRGEFGRGDQQDVMCKRRA